MGYGWCAAASAHAPYDSLPEFVADRTTVLPCSASDPVPAFAVTPSAVAISSLSFAVNTGSAPLASGPTPYSASTRSSARHGASAETAHSRSCSDAERWTEHLTGVTFQSPPPSWRRRNSLPSGFISSCRPERNALAILMRSHQPSRVICRCMLNDSGPSVT